MATQNLAAGALAARGTLAASTEDTINFVEDLDSVDVAADGTADVYFTVDKSAAAAGSNTSYRLPATGGWNSLPVRIPTAGATQIRIISTGTPKYEITKLA